MFQIGTWNSLSFLNITDDNESLSQLNKTLKVLTVLVSAYTKNTEYPENINSEVIPRKNTEVIHCKNYRGYSEKKPWVFLLKRGHS